MIIAAESQVITDEKTLEYIKRIDDGPLLTAKRERELAEIIRKYKSGKVKAEATKELIEKNLKLVVKDAYRYSRKTGIEVGDMIGAGNEGLMRAVEKFNPKKFKTRFSTYATYWIREAMQDLTYKSMSAVTIPVHISNGVAREKKILESGKPIKDKEMMQELGVNEAGLKRIRDAHVLHTVSLNDQITTGKDGSIITIGDTIEDESAVDPTMSSENGDQHALLFESLDELDEISRAVVMARYLGNDKVQLRKLGKKFKVTGERIRQISEKALKILRRKIEIKTKNGSKKKV